MAGKGVSALYGVKPGNAKALSAAVTAKAWASEAPARASMAAGVASRVAHMGAGSSAGAAAPKLSAASPSPSTHAPASSGSGRKMTFSGLAGQQGRAQPDAHVTAETRHGHPGHYVHFKGDDGKPAQIYSQTKAGADAVRDILAKGRSGGYDVKAISSALLTAPTGSGSAGAPGSKTAHRSPERNAALLNKLQDRAGRAMMKNDPSYEQKRSRLLAVKAALPAEHVATAESARAAKNAASVASVKATMRGKGGGSGMRQLVKELDAAKRVEAGQPRRHPGTASR